MSSSFPDSSYALEVLSLLRSCGLRSARKQLDDYLFSNINGPLLFELNNRFNAKTGPHLVIDSIWFSQRYGGISRVWDSILDTFRLPGLFSDASPLTFISRQNNHSLLDDFTFIQASPIDPFDYSQYPFVSQENQHILTSITNSVFCSSWVTTSGSTSVVPEVTLVHDLLPELFDQTLTTYSYCRHRWLSRSASALAVSSFTASSIKSLYPSVPNVQWCHPPSSLAYHCLPSNSELDTIWADLRLKFDSALGYFYLPSPASLGSYKNPDVLLDALSDPRLARFHLIISGVGHFKLREQISHSYPSLVGRVHFAGFTDIELIAVYKNVICLVLPSLAEGFGLPVIEAASLGCLSVIADSPGLIEAGLNCSLRFPSSNSNILADILVALTDPQSFSWFKSKLLPRLSSRVSLLSSDLLALSLLAQARSASV